MLSFAECIQVEPIQLDYAALLLSREIQYAKLDIERWMDEITRFVTVLRPRIYLRETMLDKLRCINTYLFDEIGFYGNSDNYYDPRNSFLNDVITRRTGIPITLSILYLAIAQRLELPVYGVGLPGHFIVGCSDVDGEIYVDPYNEGLILTADECYSLARAFTPEELPVPPDLLSPQANDLILMRMLNNLRQIYLSRSEPTQLLRVLRLQQTLAPYNPTLQREIGVLYFHLESWSEAIRTLKRYLFAYPDTEDYESTQTMINEAINKLSRWN